MNTNIARLAVTGTLAALGFAGIGAPGAFAAESSTFTETTISVNGAAYTCAEVVDDATGACTEGIQQAFDLYGGSVDGYVQSGELGVISLKAYDYHDAAYAGLLACNFAATDLNGYAAYLQGSGDAALSDLTADDLGPAFSAAHERVCPGV